VLGLERELDAVGGRDVARKLGVLPLAGERDLAADVIAAARDRGPGGDERAAFRIAGQSGRVGVVAAAQLHGAERLLLARGGRRGEQQDDESEAARGARLHRGGDTTLTLIKY
jgi:hypothetical protein